MTTETEPALPPLMTRIGNARQAARRVLGRALRGQPLRVSSDEARRRLAICASCSSYRASDKTCAECGCYIAAKARLASEQCPTSKWNESDAPVKPLVLRGAMLFAEELGLREIVPPEHRLIQLFNQFRMPPAEGECRKPACRQRQYAMGLQAALVDFLVNTASLREFNQVKALFLQTTHVDLGREAKSWTLFEQAIKERTSLCP